MSTLSDISSEEEETLQDTLRNRLVESVFDKTPRLFLPRGALNQVVTRTSVLEALDVSIPDDEDDELVRFILRSAKKVFATIVFVGVRPLRRAMQLFKSHSFDDGKLPLENYPDAGPLHPFEAMEDRFARHRKRIWTRARIINFHEHQWKFLAFVFSIPETSFDLENQSLGEETIPFVKRLNHIREGSFGSLVPYAIHPDHIKFSSDSFRPNIIAVKRVSLDADTQELRIQQWLAESRVAVVMNALRQDHIVRFVTAFRRLESSCLREHYLMSEWADGGDLTDMWAAIPRPVLTTQLIRAFIMQLLGIARALNAAHKIQGKESAGGMFHGSLKPTRIFWFRYGDEFGTLKIGGWGKVPSNLAFVHAEKAMNMLSTSAPYLDRRYSAPEIWALSACCMPRPEYVRTFEDLRCLQANDVWALGCITFECMIWLLDGSHEIARFRRQSNRYLDSGSPFYQIKSVGDSFTTETHTVVIRKMEEMAHRKPSLMGTSALGDVLGLIRTGLLIVEDCGPRHPHMHGERLRLNAEQLVSKLELICHEPEPEFSARRSKQKSS